MAALFVYHLGSNTSPYDTWAKAATTLLVAAAAAPSAETIYVAHDHVETNASATTIVYTNSTSASPVKVICGTRSGTNAISGLATTAQINCSSTTFTVSTNSYYCYGLNFIATSGAGVQMRLSYHSGGTVVYDHCTFVFTGTSTSSRFRIGSDQSAVTCTRSVFYDCFWKLAQGNQVTIVDAFCEIFGGGYLSGSANPSGSCFVTGDLRGCRLEISGFDFSTLSAGINLFAQGGTTQFARARNVKMPSTWSGSIHSAASAGGGTRWELHNYGVGDTNYRFWTSDPQGQVIEDTDVHCSGGAQDETVGYSQKLISSSNVSWPGHALRSLPIAKRWVGQGGTVFHVFVNVCHNGAVALTDKEVWVEAEFYADPDFPIVSFANDRRTLLEYAAGQPHPDLSGSVTWIGATGAGPNESGNTHWNIFACDVDNLNIATTGYIVARIHLAKPGYTIYVDPKLTVTI